MSVEFYISFESAYNSLLANTSYFYLSFVYEAWCCMDKHMSELMKTSITESVFEHVIFISVLSSLDEIQY